MKYIIHCVFRDAVIILEDKTEYLRHLLDGVNIEQSGESDDEEDESSDVVCTMAAFHYVLKSTANVGAG